MNPRQLNRFPLASRVQRESRERREVRNLRVDLPNIEIEYSLCLWRLPLSVVSLAVIHRGITGRPREGAREKAIKGRSRLKELSDSLVSPSPLLRTATHGQREEENRCRAVFPRHSLCVSLSTPGTHSSSLRAELIR